MFSTLLYRAAGLLAAAALVFVCGVRAPEPGRGTLAPQLPSTASPSATEQLRSQAAGAPIPTGPGTGARVPGQPGVSRPSAGAPPAEFLPVFWGFYESSTLARDAIAGLPPTDPLRAVTAGAALVDLEASIEDLESLDVPPVAAGAKLALLHLTQLRAGYAGRVATGEALPSRWSEDAEAGIGFLAVFDTLAFSLGVDPAAVKRDTGR